MISKLLAVAGAGVTLIGVVMLLVIAAQAGFFGPVARVTAGAALSIVLVGIGARVFGRTGGRVGGIALAATGIAGAYLDVMAVTSIYGWLVPPLGLLVALGVGAFGVALAAKWQSQSLALLVVVGVAVLAPIVTDGITLVLIGFLIVIQIACYPVQLVRPWPYLEAARTIPVVLALLLAIALSVVDSDSSNEYWLLASSIVVALVGIAAVVPYSRRSVDVLGSAMFATAALPLLFTSALFDRPIVVAIEAPFAAVLLLIAALPMFAAHTRIAAVTVAVLALLQTTFAATDRNTLAIALLVVAAGFIAASDRLRSKVAYGIGFGFTVVAGLAYLAQASPDSVASASRAVENLGSSVVLAGAAAIAVLVLVVWVGQRSGIVAKSTVEPVTFIAGLAGLYAMTTATVAAGVAIAGRDGFIGGHCVATITWMIVATLVLMRGLRVRSNAHLTLLCGLALCAAAIAKLFLFDLATLDGLFRVSAFIAVGLLLLVAGTKYARAFAERESAAELAEQQASDGSPAPAAR